MEYGAVRDETDSLIVRTIQMLTIEHREVLTLRFFGGHSYEEIGDETSEKILSY